MERETKPILIWNEYKQLQRKMINGDFQTYLPAFLFPIFKEKIRWQ
jgi:hypothetical protein